jgi:alpha-amylase
MTRRTPTVRSSASARRSLLARTLLSLLRALRVSVLGLFLPRAVAQQVVPLDSPLIDDVVYQFMPIAWRDSDNDVAPEGGPLRFGDFRGMTDSLDYLQQLGITAVWMTPIFPSPAYHGYQHMPADRLNPRLGTEQEWTGFVRAAHARGIKVFIDFVAYGISTDSEYFRDAHLNPQSRYDPWLAFTDDANSKYTGYTFKTWDGTSVGFIHWDLNHPEPRRLVTEWAKKWLDPDGDGDFTDGVDGYRLDHVWTRYKDSPPSKNGWGYTLADVWIPWKEALRRVNPRVITFAEQAQWETTGAEVVWQDASGRTGFDAAFTKPLEMAVREGLRTGKALPLRKAMEATARSLIVPPPDRAADLPAGTRCPGTYLAILGDHDVDRLASVVEEGVDTPGRRLDATSNLARCKLGAVILLAQPFPPIIYMGDEIGMRGVRQKYGSDASDIPVREPFKWKAAAGPPMSNYWAPAKAAVEHAFSSDHDGRSVEEQQGVTGSLLEEYRRLVALRRATPALRRGSFVQLPPVHAAVWAFARRHEEQTVVVLVNLSGDRVSATVNLQGLGNETRTVMVRDLLAAADVGRLTTEQRNRYPFVLPPFGYGVWSLEPETLPQR